MGAILKVVLSLRYTFIRGVCNKFALINHPLDFSGYMLYCNVFGGFKIPPRVHQTRSDHPVEQRFPSTDKDYHLIVGKLQHAQGSSPETCMQERERLPTTWTFEFCKWPICLVFYGSISRGGVVGALCLHVYVRVPSWLNGRHTWLAGWLDGCLM